MEYIDFNFIRDIWHFTIISIDERAVTFGSIVVGLVFFILGIKASKYFSRTVSRFAGSKFRINRNSRHVLESLIFYFLIFLSSLFALKLAHIPITVFTVLGGGLAIGVGFGSRNLVSNFISGIILMIETPIKVGDFVEVDGIFGEVDNIGIRSTSIISKGNKHTIVPNSFFLEKNLINWTHKNSLIQISIKIGVAYGSDTKKVKELLVKAALLDSNSLKKPSPSVYFTDFADNSLNFELEFPLRIKTLNQRRQTESQVRFHIDELFRDAGISIAFPQRDVHFFQDKPIEVRIKSQDQRG